MLGEVPQELEELVGPEVAVALRDRSATPEEIIEVVGELELFGTKFGTIAGRRHLASGRTRQLLKAVSLRACLSVRIGVTVDLCNGERRPQRRYPAK